MHQIDFLITVLQFRFVLRDKRLFHIAFQVLFYAVGILFWFETVSPNYSQPGERLRINRRKCSGFFMYRARDILKCRGKVKPLAPIFF